MVLSRYSSWVIPIFLVLLVEYNLRGYKSVTKLFLLTPSLEVISVTHFSNSGRAIMDVFFGNVLRKNGCAFNGQQTMKKGKRCLEIDCDLVNSVFVFVIIN